MDDGGLNANTAATLALLADTSRAGGRGGMYGGGGYGEGGFGGGMMFPGNSMLTAGAHADGTAIKEGIDCNAIRVSDGIARVSAQAEEGRRSAQVTSLQDSGNTNNARVTDNQFRAELRLSDSLNAHSTRISDTMSSNTLTGAINDGNVRVESVRQFADMQKAMADCCCDTAKAIADAAKDAAQCCCDAKLQSCQDHSDLKALVIQENSATRELIRGDALAAANAKIVQLETINALSRHHG